MNIVRAAIAALMVGCAAETEPPEPECDVVSDNQRTLDPNGNPSDVDWGRHEVLSRATNNTGRGQSPLGDATKWGARIKSDLPAGPNPGFIVTSPQFIRVQCTDHYARVWSVVGNLTVPNALIVLPDIFSPLGPFPDSWGAQLVVFFGTGQDSVQHNINLRATIAADAPFYAPNNFGNPTGVLNLPFVIPGAIVANAVAMHVLFNGIYTNAVPAATVTTQVLLAPFNAGTGL